MCTSSFRSNNGGYTNGMESTRYWRYSFSISIHMCSRVVHYSFGVAAGVSTISRADSKGPKSVDYATAMSYWNKLSLLGIKKSIKKCDPSAIIAFYVTPVKTGSLSFTSPWGKKRERHIPKPGLDVGGRYSYSLSWKWMVWRSLFQSRSTSGFEFRVYLSSVDQLPYQG